MKPETLKALVAFTREVETAIENLYDDDKPQMLELKDIGSGLRRMLNAEAAEQIAIAKLTEDSMPHNDSSLEKPKLVTYTIFQGFPILNGENIYDPCGEEPYKFISSDPKSKTVCVKNTKGDFLTFPALRFDITFKTEEADE